MVNTHAWKPGPVTTAWTIGHGLEAQSKQEHARAELWELQLNALSEEISVARGHKTTEGGALELCVLDAARTYFQRLHIHKQVVDLLTQRDRDSHGHSEERIQA